jgi:hypothetical protein
MDTHPFYGRRESRLAVAGHIRNAAGDAASYGTGESRRGWVRLLLSRRCVHRVVIVALLASAAPAFVTAQTPREDAIRAFMVGDHERAIRLLGPLADDPRSADGVAAFLLATLYERKGGSNTFRACGLFLKAAALPGPFSDQAAQIARSMREELGRAVEFCRPEARWRELPRATFVLGTDHSIEYTEDGIVIRYRGEEKRTMTGTLPDAVPLTPAYTPVDVTAPARARRHFIQSFTWWRDTATTWALGWSLVEVVGTEMAHVTGERRVIASAAPDPPTIDLSTLARVRVSNSGEAEWTIGGLSPRSAVIPWKERQ